AEIRAILFDKDGTLLDFNATWLGFARELAAEAAPGDDEEALRLLERTGFNRHTSSFEPGSILAVGTNAEVIAAIYPSLSGEALRRKILEADRRAAERASSAAVPLAGVVETVGHLRR